MSSIDMSVQNILRTNRQRKVMLFIIFAKTSRTVYAIYVDSTFWHLIITVGDLLVDIYDLNVHN